MHGWARGPPPVGAVGRQVQSAPEEDKQHKLEEIYPKFLYNK